MTVSPRQKKKARLNRKEKKPLSFDLAAVYQQCLSACDSDESSLLSNPSSLRQLEESGLIELHLWPLILESTSKLMKISDNTNTNTINEAAEFMEKSSFVLLKLVNARNLNVHFSKSDLNGPLSFMKVQTKKGSAEFLQELNMAAFQKFLETILNAKIPLTSTSTSVSEQCVDLYPDIIQFLSVAYANLTKELCPVLHESLMNLVGIGMWECMPKRYRDLLISKSNAMKRRWNFHLERKKKKNDGEDMEVDGGGIESGSGDNLYLFLPNMLSEFMKSLDQDNANDNDNSKSMDLKTVLSTIQLLVDLLSNTSTRRYLRPYLLSIHLSTKCKLSSHYNNYNSSTKKNTNKNPNVFHQLVDTLQELESFAIDDITATPLSFEEKASQYHERAHVLQKMCLRHKPDVLSDIVYAGVGMVADEGFLRKVLDRVVEDEHLVDLCHRLRLMDRETLEETFNENVVQGEGEGEGDGDGDDDNDNDDGRESENRRNKIRKEKRKFVTEVLLYHHALQPSESKVLSELPLYPDERLLWNPHLVPPGNPRYGDESTSTLALPKMSLSFLTYSDYLLRCFKLLRLESAYEIRGDVVDVVRRMRPALRHGYQDEMDLDDADVDEDEKWSKKRSLTEFHGWSRMGLELTEDTICPVRLIRVSPPKLGEKIPSEVLAEITLDLKHCGQSIRQEWDSVGEFDNLFLLGIDATVMSGGAAPLLDGQDANEDKRIPDEEDVSFRERFGIIAVRGCMVLEVRDDNGNILSDPTYSKEYSKEQGKESKTKDGDAFKRHIKVALDPAQYAADATGGGSPFGTKVYQTLNVIMRRHGKENNFKSILETVKGLMKGAGSVNRSVPRWLQPVLLGYGNPASASYNSANMKKFAKNTTGVNSPDAALDYGDTFISELHLRESFVGSTIVVDGEKDTSDDEEGSRKKYRIQLENIDGESTVKATSYPFPANINGNPVPFTPVQVKAIHSGLSPGLTMIVGPPGTGKTDVAVQIIANLYHSFPSQRTILVTHSNAALNDLFEKVMVRGDIDERYMLRLGSGERDLQTETEFDFTKTGRVNHILSRRSKLLEKVQCMSECLGISGANDRGPDGSPSYTCETAAYFYLHHIEKRIKLFNNEFEGHSDDSVVGPSFPFMNYFQESEADNLTLTLSRARKMFEELKECFTELDEYRPLELLRSQRQRIDYLLTNQVKIVAMTCTHAAIARSHLIKLGFQYDNVIMEEAGQMLDIETFVPLLLQSGEVDSNSRLKRICLIGDQNQLPPVVKNITFSKYSNLDQSLFTRLIRLGVPTIELNKQGRSRPEIAKLYNWRYNDLGNLEHVSSKEKFKFANPGFTYSYQLVNVEDFEGRGESAPTPYYYQNTGEAEYAVALFQYMVLIGYPPEKISILTTYNGQKGLIEDILSQRCGSGTPLAGIRPGALSTVDKYQGQQNDYIILSLVRTKSVGHLRDVRRLIVAVSRARFGMYVLCRQSVFNGCHELSPVMKQFAKLPNELSLVTSEEYGSNRSGRASQADTFIINDVAVIGSIVHNLQEQMMAK